MEWLRWILLAAGVLLIGAIYLSGQGYQRRRDVGPEPGSGAAWEEPYFEPPPAEPWHPAEEAPLAGPEQAVAGQGPGTDEARVASAPESDSLASGAPAEAPFDLPVADEPTDPEPPPAPEREPVAEAPAPERIVVLYVVAREGQRLVGAQLAAAFSRHGLEHGERGAFHARAADAAASAGEPAAAFSVANVVEPGSFDLATMDTLSTPGVALFLRVPGPASPVAAFDRMVTTARGLAQDLDARVLDERRTPLTRQAEQHLRDELRRMARAPQPVRGGQ